MKVDFLVMGAGADGTPAAKALAGSGVVTIGIRPVTVRSRPQVR